MSASRRPPGTGSPPDDRVVLRLGAGLADSLAALRVALDRWAAPGGGLPAELVRAARSACRQAETYRRLLALLARYAPPAAGAADACVVLRGVLAAAPRDDRDAGIGVSCPGTGSAPVGVAADRLAVLCAEWWRGTRAVLGAPRELVVVPPGEGPFVELRAVGRRLGVDRGTLEEACAIGPGGRLRACALPPEAWSLAAARVLAGRVRGGVVVGEDRVALRLPAWRPEGSA